MKSPKIHPRFYPSTLVLVLASQIPVPLFKKKNLSCQGNSSEQGIGKV